MRPTIESGTTISHYRVLSPLGAGGMGEVYKAHDNTLERVVALKILPPQLVRNEERLRRFVQEAKSASSLNHPHIVTIHEIGEAVASSSDRDADKPTSLHYIAMELIDGVTLKKKIHDEQTDLRTLLSFAAQAAEGLAKAHQAGIVHRDLKPENIMVTRDGFAKVLDFGLAKLNVKKAAPEGHTQATAIRDETREGALLGTVAYMSPEQVQGKAVDHRADIFAFGAILYEAATRRRPFEADSDVDVMHKILHDKPAPVEEISPNVPAELRRMIRRCLAKEPEKRFQSMKDIALELTEIVDEFEQLSLLSSTRGSSSTSRLVLAAPPRRPLWIVLSLVALLGIAGIAFGVYQWRKSRAGGRPATAFASMNLRQLTATGNITRAVVSPDGKYVAYIPLNAGEVGIWVRQVATGSDVQVVPPGPERFSGLTFSPDGNYLFYSRTEPGQGANYSWLFSVPALGGTPRKLLFDVDTAVAFSPDGKQIAFGRGAPQLTENHLIVANADGTAQRKLAVFKRFENPARPVWTPDGAKIITSTIDVSSGWTAYPVEVDVATGARRRVGNTRWFYVEAFAFTPDGKGLIMPATDAETARTQIWLQPFPDGTPVRVTNDLNNYFDLSTTHDGAAIAALQSQTDTELRLAEAGDAAGGRVFAPTPNQRVEDVSVAATGAVAFSFFSGNTAHVALIDSPGVAPRVLTRQGENFDGSITADGRTVVFQSERGAALPHVFAIDADGSNERQVTNGSGEVAPVVSPDGRFVVYRHIDQSLWIQPLTGGTPRRISVSVNGPAAISPDSQRIAFLAWRQAPGSDRAASHLLVVPLAGGPSLVDVPWRGGGRMRWHPKEDAITFRRFAGGADNIFAQPLTGGEARQITKFTSGQIPSFDWMPDGKLLIVRGNERSDVVLITDYRPAE